MPCQETDESRCIAEENRGRESTTTETSSHEKAKVPIQAPTPAPAEYNQAKLRASEAKLLVTKLQKNKATYVKEMKTVNGNEVSTRKWDDFTISDCTKFVQWALEWAKQGSLFGRDNATTESMMTEIERLEGPSWKRKLRPAIGDLMFWGGHVAIVSGIDDKKQLLAVSQMDSTGAHTYDTIPLPPSKQFDLKVDGGTDDKGKPVPPLGGGGFLGFWTPPDTTGSKK